jgi:1-acyl-sn-glycerol-3-phosphate acyltransferase
MPSLTGITDHRIPFMLHHGFFLALLKLAVRIFFRRRRVVGLENVPNDGAIIFVGNHPEMER